MTKSVTATPLALPQLLFMSDYALMQEQAHDWLRMRRNAVQLSSGLAAAGTPWTAFIADVSAFSSSATSKSPCAHSPCIECMRKGLAKQTGMYKCSGQHLESPRCSSPNPLLPCVAELGKPRKGQATHKALQLANSR